MSILSEVLGMVVAGGGSTTFGDAWTSSLAIGSACAGGYYAGRVVDGGVTYALIIAPKASGANGGATMAYKTTADAAPAACQTLTNGPAATAAMAAVGAAYPAASYCAGLVINGYDDWYLPARDELEILYRNLKPNSTLNNTGVRPTGIYGGDGLTYGTNDNSSPVGAGYTSTSPAMTTVPVFQTAEESLVAFNYWSSTESSATNAWRQAFSNGGQGSSNATSAVYVRAVRRVAV